MAGPSIEKVTQLVGPSWAPHLFPVFQSEEVGAMAGLIAKERREQEVYPESQNVFRAFRECSYEDMKVIIIGQDPYHTPGVANGLAFSYVGPIPYPPSLVNIFKELEDDVGFGDPSPNPDLARWARQGVLLLNTALTVRKGEADSHAPLWKAFMEQALEVIGNKYAPLVWISWGARAKGVAYKYGDPFFHKILWAPHPSPLSAHRGFFGSKPFSQTNEWLDGHGLPVIDWHRNLPTT
jgi:uracil-DNA glycosylase